MVVVGCAARNHHIHIIRIDDVATPETENTRVNVHHFAMPV